MEKLPPLPLHELIGASVAALVKADAHAFKAIAELIEVVGFVKGESKNGEHLGELRYVTFTYQKPNVSGKMTVHQVQIPILSLIALNPLKIDEAELDFYFGVLGAEKTRSLSFATFLGKEASEWLNEVRYDLVGRVECYSGENIEGSHQKPLIKVKYKVKSADFPVGYLNLFRKLDENIKDQSKNVK